MKRGLSVSFLVACALAGVLAAYAFAGGPVPLAGTTTTGTTTTTATASTTTVGTSTTTTTPITTITATTTTTTPRLLPEGVTIGGIPVGNLSPSEAASEIRAYFSTPLRLRLGKHVYTADPNALATPKITKAVARAKRARTFANLGLAVAVKTVKVRAFVASLAPKIEKAPVDSHLILRNLKPFLTRERAGVALVQPVTVNAVTKALRLNERGGFVKLRTTRTKAEVTRKSFGPVIVIHRGSNRLYLYRGVKMDRIFPVATGQSVYPTPLGSFQIVVMWRNPWWYPPNSAWAKGEQPVPPGPNNPLGTRWMGISSPGVGIHGTNNDASIGYSVSHGCIRMHVHDAEWLFNHVVVGTPVFIVSS
jgi:lipoprotein-anchoring transpeptidase ErfK/SrfK